LNRWQPPFAEGSCGIVCAYKAAYEGTIPFHCHGFAAAGTPRLRWRFTGDLSMRTQGLGTVR
jgi:hypothetical protein